MAELDRLIGAMAQRDATRAVLTADQATRLTVKGEDISGSVISAAKVQSMLAEILSFDDYQRLFKDGQFEVPYNSPHGSMRISIWRTQGVLGATIEPFSGVMAPPAAAMPSPTPPPQPAVPTVHKPPSIYQGGMSSQPVGLGPIDTHNTSGMGSMATMPPEIAGWSWGAFLANWIWGIGNNVWLALLCWIPCVGWVMPFVLGAKGNEWAWQNKRYDSIEQFKQVQKTWAIVGVGLFFAQFLICTPIFLLPTLAYIGAGIGSDLQKREANLTNLASAIDKYAAANNGKYPPYADYNSWKAAVLPYVDGQNEKVFVSPSDGKPYVFNTRLADLPKINVTNPSKFPLVWEDESSSSHNMVFADGTFKTFDDQEWTQWLEYAKKAPLPMRVP